MPFAQNQIPFFNIDSKQYAAGMHSLFISFHQIVLFKITYEYIIFLIVQQILIE